MLCASEMFRGPLISCLCSLFVVCLTIPHGSYAQLNAVRYAGNPVIRSQAKVDDPYALYFTHSPTVVVERAADSSTTYKMWFSSWTGWPGSVWTICYAESRDGLNWFLYLGSPVFGNGGWGSFDANRVIDPCVLKVGNEYWMYYTAYNGAVWQVGHARSGDGIHWQRIGSDPALGVEPGNWDSFQSNAPAVVARDTDYVMLYTGGAGSDYKIGMARSKDGITWERGSSLPVLLPGDSGSWDTNGVIVSSLIRRDSLLYLFYHSPSSSPSSGGAFGLAMSRDGLLWQKYPGNPIFLPASGQWDARIQTASYAVVNDTLRLWYGGFDLTWQIGAASFTTPWHDITLSASADVPIPSRFSLSEGYPNPFNPTAVIEFEIPEMVRVTIKVYNALGQQVGVLVDEVKPPGHYKATWVADGLASGAFFCRMEAGSYSATKKLVLLK